jgi:hypothetical protein
VPSLDPGLLQALILRGDGHPPIRVESSNRTLKEVTVCQGATKGVIQTEVSKRSQITFIEDTIGLAGTFGHAS